MSRMVPGMLILDTRGTLNASRIGRGPSRRLRYTAFPNPLSYPEPPALLRRCCASYECESARPCAVVAVALSAKIIVHIEIDFALMVRTVSCCCNMLCADFPLACPAPPRPLGATLCWPPLLAHSPPARYDSLTAVPLAPDLLLRYECLFISPGGNIMKAALHLESRPLPSPDGSARIGSRNRLNFSCFLISPINLLILIVPSPFGPHLGLK